MNNLTFNKKLRIFSQSHNGNCHVHHEAMTEYGISASSSPTPWIKWYIKEVGGDCWRRCTGHPLWFESEEYAVEVIEVIEVEEVEEDF